MSASVFDRVASLSATFTAESGPVVNGVATASVAAPLVGHRIYVLGLSISCNGAPVAFEADLVEAKPTPVNRGRFLFPALAFAPFEVQFSRARVMAEATGCSLTIPALGAGVAGSVQIHYAVATS